MLLETETRNMKMAKIKQISLVLCCMFSLFVSSVSACYCAHGEAVDDQTKPHCAPQSITHKEKTENHSVDHHLPNASNQNHHEAFSEIVIDSVNQSDECCCIQPAQKNYAKSEGVKIQKQNVLLLTFAPLELNVISPPRAIKTIQFAVLFYLSDSFHNLTPGRGPPMS
jgi:hypothetical protein